MDDELVMWRLGGLPWGTRIRRFDRATLAKVQVVDSVREGLLWGVGAGVGTTMAFVASCSRSGDPECRGWAVFAGIGVGGLEILVSTLIDASINQSVFSRSPERHVALRVRSQRDAAVLQLTIEF